MRANTVSEDDARGKLEEIRFACIEVSGPRKKSWKPSEEVTSLTLVDRAGHVCHS
jgi:hypothetical protein